VLFATSHCQPSINFIQQIIEAYSEVNASGTKVFEIVLASGDTDEDEYTNLFQQLPFLSFGFRSKMIGQLMRQLGVKKSPFLAVIDRDGTLITKDGKSEFL